MSGAAKKVAKPFKSIGKAIGNLVDMSAHPLSTIKKGIGSVTGMLQPEIPGAPDAPLMPDLEGIERGRRRRRANKMGRESTIMTSDVLG